MGILVALYFFEVNCEERGQLSLGDVTSIELWYGSNVIVVSFDYDNLTLKLHHEKRIYPDERWLFIGRFKVGWKCSRKECCSCSI